MCVCLWLPCYLPIPRRLMIPTVIKVYLSAEDSTSIVEVPITPNTTVADVVEFCKEPGEEGCGLLEKWRGKKRAIDLTERPYTILQQVGVLYL